MQFITFQNFHIQTCFSQFLWFFSLKCWFKGQMISRIHLILPNAYKLMCFDRNINGNRDVKFLECDKWSLHWYKNLTLVVDLCYFALFEDFSPYSFHRIVCYRVASSQNLILCNRIGNWRRACLRHRAGRQKKGLVATPLYSI